MLGRGRSRSTRSCASRATAPTARARRWLARPTERRWRRRSPASPRLLGNADYVTKVLLHGMTGELDGKNYPGGGVMVPMGTNTDEWIADVASYVRNSFGNSATVRDAGARRRRAQGEPAHVDVVLRRARLDDADAAAEPGRSGRRRPATTRRRRPTASTARGRRAGRAGWRKSRGCGSRSSCRSQRTSPRSSSTRWPAGAEGSASGADEAALPAGPLSRPTASRCRWTARPGARPSRRAGAESDDHDRRSRPCGPVRPHHADRHAAARQRVGDPARAHLQRRNPPALMSGLTRSSPRKNRPPLRGCARFPAAAGLIAGAADRPASGRSAPARGRVRLRAVSGFLVDHLIARLISLPMLPNCSASDRSRQRPRAMSRCCHSVIGAPRAQPTRR